MGDQQVLGLLRIDVHTARDDRVGRPVGQEQEAVGVHVTHVADGRTAGPQIGLGGLFGVVAVLELNAAVEVDITDFAHGQFVSVRVRHDDPANHRLAHSAGILRPVFGCGDGDAIGLGSGVIFDQDRTPPINHRGLDVFGTGRGGVEGDLQRRDIVFGAHRVRQFQHPHEHRRHDLGVRDLMRLDQAQHLFGVEPFHDDRRAAQHHRHHRGPQRSRMIKRRGRQIDRVRIHTRHGFAKHGHQTGDDRVDRLRGEAAGDALGPPRCARGIQQIGPGGFVRNGRGGLGGLIGQPVLPGGRAGTADEEPHVGTSGFQCP